MCIFSDDLVEVGHAGELVEVVAEACELADGFLAQGVGCGVGGGFLEGLSADVGGDVDAGFGGESSDACPVGIAEAEAAITEGIGGEAGDGGASDGWGLLSPRRGAKEASCRIYANGAKLPFAYILH
ncbi:MAG: hypothetical protein AAGN66_24005 [Acidobacteriota bacterium]